MSTPDTVLSTGIRDAGIRDARADVLSVTNGTDSGVTSVGAISSTLTTTEQFTGLVSFVVASWAALFTVAVTMVAIYAMNVMTRNNSLRRATSRPLLLEHH